MYVRFTLFTRTKKCAKYQLILCAFMPLKGQNLGSIYGPEVSSRPHNSQSTLGPLVTFKGLIKPLVLTTGPLGHKIN